MTLLLDVFLPVLVVPIMTIVGMDLRFTDFLRVRRYPLLVPATIVSRWVAAILVAVLVGRLLELPQAVAGGVLLLLVGMSIRHCAAAWTLRFRRQLQLLAALAIATVFGFVVVNQSTAIGKDFGTLLATSLLFTLTTLGIGVIVVRLLTRSVRDRRALLWGFPARNVAVAVFIATAVVGRAEMASSAAVLLATQLALFVPLGGGRKLHRWRCGRNLHAPAGWRFR
jgi:predicted Na+-dependent transporter